MKHKKAGLIGNVSDENLMALRDPKLYTDDENKFINLLSLKHDAIAQPIGSFTHKIQKYASDIDINEVVTIKNNNFNVFISDLQDNIRKILKAKNVYFSDFKAGLDVRYPNDKEKFVLRWSPQEILNGYKVLEGGVKISLIDAVKMVSILKMDLIVFTNNRFIEESAFYILESVTPEGKKFINVPADYYEIFKEALKKDIKKYSTNGENFKIFKAVKRMWSLARLTKDTNMLRALKPLIDSNLSLLGQINADLETLELLVDKISTYSLNIPNNQMIDSIELIGKKLSNVADINLDYKIINNLIKELTNFLKKKNIKSFEPFKKTLELFHDYLLSVINKEALEYMKYSGLIPIPSMYLPTNIKAGIIYDDQSNSTFKKKRYSLAGCNNPNSQFCPKNKGGRMHPKYYADNYIQSWMTKDDRKELIKKFNEYKKKLSNKDFDMWLECIKGEGVLSTNCDLN